MRSFSKRLCIIPARGGSKRLPRKNLVKLAGKPLLQYAVEVAFESNLFDSICVSSDDTEILALANSLGAKSERRSDELSSDTAQLKEVCLDILDRKRDEGFDAFCLLLPGHPLRTPIDIRNSYQILQQYAVDTVLSMVPMGHPPQRCFKIVADEAVPFLGIEQFKRTQDLEPLFRHDGAVAWTTVSSFVSLKSLVAGRIAPYLIPIERSVDIDNQMDLQWAEFLLSRTT